MATTSFELKDGWTYINSDSKAQSILPSTFLVQQIATKECCTGTYITSIPIDFFSEKIGENKMYGIYFPGIGGLQQIRLNSQVLPTKTGSDYTSKALIIPINESLLNDKSLELQVDIKGNASYFLGLFPPGKHPVIGEISSLLEKQALDEHYQKTVPIFISITLLIFALTFSLIYFLLNKRTKVYIDFSIALGTWSVFYMFLSGIVRSNFFFLGTLLHFPARTLASLGLFLLIRRSAPIGNIGNKIYLTLFTFSILIQIIFGLLNLPVLQSGTFAVTSLLSFAPLISFKYKKTDPIGALIAFFGLIAVFGQVLDSIKLHEIYFGFHLELPFFNRVSFFPLLLVSFGDCIIQFSSSFHQLRAHLFKAKSYARTILHSAKEGLSHDNINYFLKVTSKICAFNRVSLAQRQEDGSYQVVKLYGSKFSAEGATINLNKSKEIKQSIIDGKITFGSMQNISDGWKTSEFIAVPIPQEKNPHYLMLLSEQKKANLTAIDALPYLSQISSAIWTNLERTKEQLLRVQTEKKFSSLVQKLDPSLYEFITNNMNKIADPELLISSTRGIVFFDQKAYSTMTEDFDDTTMGKFACIIGEWVTNSAARYGARISNFAGDAFLLETFSIGSESEESIAQRTLNLVWSLAQTMGELNQILLKEGFTPITFRFGAHIGNVTAANLDFIQKGLSNSIGDTVNVAARLQSIAKAGSIYISGDLEKYTLDKFASTPVPKQYVKGRMKKIDIFSLVGKMDSDEKDAA